MESVWTKGTTGLKRKKCQCLTCRTARRKWREECDCLLCKANGTELDKADRIMHAQLMKASLFPDDIAFLQELEDLLTAQKLSMKEWVRIGRRLQLTTPARTGVLMLQLHGVPQRSQDGMEYRANEEQTVDGGVTRNTDTEGEDGIGEIDTRAQPDGTNHLAQARKEEATANIPGMSQPSSSRVNLLLGNPPHLDNPGVRNNLRYLQGKLISTAKKIWAPPMCLNKMNGKAIA